MTDEKNSALVNLKTSFLDTLGRMEAVVANGEHGSAVLDAVLDLMNSGVGGADLW